MNDPRHNAPSASSARMLWECPPSFKMQQGLPDFGNPDAESGTAIHKALETGNLDALTEDQRETARMCADQLEQELQRWVQTV